MAGTRKLFFLIPSLVLIAILLGITPVNLMHNTASGHLCPHAKQQIHNHCLFNSVTSHPDLSAAILDSTLSNQSLTSLEEFHPLLLASFDANHFENPVPLRC